MKLPHYEQAVVAERKIASYLLSTTHPVGRSKARYFLRHGYSVANWQAFADALRRHAAEHEVVEIQRTSRGISYTVEGALTAPTGQELVLRVVWFQDVGEPAPHLVTAYPLKGAVR